MRAPMLASLKVTFILPRAADDVLSDTIRRFVYWSRDLGKRNGPETERKRNGNVLEVEQKRNRKRAASELKCSGTGVNGMPFRAIASQMGKLSPTLKWHRGAVSTLNTSQGCARLITCRVEFVSNSRLDSNEFSQR